MSFQVYNTYTRRKEPFEPREPGVVRMYNCGPTVYSRIHVGNLRSFLFADVLRRWLEYVGFEVHQVMNITDVGHILDDADEGEDKIERRARREKVAPIEIANGFADLFLADIAELGVLPAETYPRATEHVPEMLAIIEDLIGKGNAYEVDGSVYFDVASFPAYGRLSGNRVDELDAGARIEVRDEKRNPADFALWKSDPKHLMKWESRFGPDGFPGWHIECSAMAIKHLGPELDIHTGGEDNIFPHHECEIAQSECHTKRPFARYWMHARFLQIDGGKMAKSQGKVWDLDDVKERGYAPRVLRYALVRGHYRQPLSFGWEIMDEARAALDKLDDLAARLRRAAAVESSASDEEAGRSALTSAREKFEAGMNDDLNAPQALSALFELRSAIIESGVGSAAATDALAWLERADEVFGVIRFEDEAPDETLDARIAELIEARNAARERKDWAESDRLRDELERLDVVLEDSPQGTVWRRRG